MFTQARIAGMAVSRAIRLLEDRQARRLPVEVAALPLAGRTPAPEAQVLAAKSGPAVVRQQEAQWQPVAARALAEARPAEVLWARAEAPRQVGLLASGALPRVAEALALAGSLASAVRAQPALAKAALGVTVGAAYPVAGAARVESTDREAR
jgi:hypothetical protein